MRSIIAVVAGSLWLTGSAAGVQVIAGRPPADSQQSAPPAPRQSEVPESASWLLMIAGFTTIGLASRRRRSPRAVSA